MLPEKLKRAQAVFYDITRSSMIWRSSIIQEF